MTESVFLWSKTALSNGTADGAIVIPEGMLPSGVNNGVRSVMAALAKQRDDQGGQLSLAGGTTAYTLTTNQVLATLADGVRVHAVCNATNTAASTLAVDGLTAKAIRLDGDVALVAGQMKTNHHCIFEYDASLNAAAGAWVLLNPAGFLGTAGVILLQNGLVGTPSLAFAGDLNSGIFLNSADNWSQVAGGAVVTTLTATLFDVNQNFSIGVSSFTVTKASGNTDIAGTLNVGGLFTAELTSQFDGNVAVGANVVLITETSGRISHAEHIIPQVTNTSDLGTTLLGYRTAHLNDGGEINWRKTAGAVGGNFGFVAFEDVADDASVTLPLTVGIVFATTNGANTAIYSVNGSAGTIELSDSGAVWVNTDTDTNHCMFWSGSAIVIRNRRGSVQDYRVWYMECIA